MIAALRRRVRARTERGAVAVEAALVTPFLVLLVLGIVEFTMVMRDYVSVTAATRSGTRIASANAGSGVQVCDTAESGPQCSNAGAPELAKLAANAIQSQGTALNLGQVNYLLVYKADSSGYPGSLTGWSSDPKADCRTAGSCVVYTWSAIAQKFKYSTTGGTWTSTTINACVSNSNSVGVYLNTTHPFITHMFGSSFPVTDRTVMKFEPLTADTCAAGTHP